MPIRQLLHEGNLIVLPGTKLTASTTGEELSKTVIQGLSDGIRNILFDFSDVEFIDSLGVGQVVTSYRLITEAGGRLIVCGLQPRVQTVLRMANLHLVLDIREKGTGDFEW